MLCFSACVSWQHRDVNMTTGCLTRVFLSSCYVSDQSCMQTLLRCTFFICFLLYYILVCNDLIRYAIMCSWWVGVFINIFLFLFCSLGRNARYVLDAHIYVYIHTRVCVCVCIHTHEYVYAHVPILHKTGKNMWMREWSHQAYVCHAVWSTAFFFLSFSFTHQNPCYVTQ